MPIYEYECGKCRDVFELLRDRSARDDAAQCPSCGADGAARLMSSCCARVTTGSGRTAPVAGSSVCDGCQAASCAGCNR